MAARSRGRASRPAPTRRGGRRRRRCVIPRSCSLRAVTAPTPQSRSTGSGCRNASSRSGGDDEQAVGLRHAARDLGEELGARDPDRDAQARRDPRPPGASRGGDLDRSTRDPQPGRPRRGTPRRSRVPRRVASCCRTPRTPPCSPRRRPRNGARRLPPTGTGGAPARRPSRCGSRTPSPRSSRRARRPRPRSRVAPAGAGRRAARPTRRTRRGRHAGSWPRSDTNICSHFGAPRAKRSQSSHPRPPVEAFGRLRSCPVRYRRMPIEVESPEQLGYDTITNNLSESSVADRRLSDLGIDLADAARGPGPRSTSCSSATATTSATRVLREAVAAGGAGLRRRRRASSRPVPRPRSSPPRPRCSSRATTRSWSAPTTRPTSRRRARSAPISTSSTCAFDDGWRLDVERVAALVRPGDDAPDLGDMPAQPHRHDARSRVAARAGRAGRDARARCSSSTRPTATSRTVRRCRWPRRSRRARSACRRCRRRTGCRGCASAGRCAATRSSRRRCSPPRSRSSSAAPTIDEAIAGRVLSRSGAHPPADPRRRPRAARHRPRVDGGTRRVVRVGRTRGRGRRPRPVPRRASRSTPPASTTGCSRSTARTSARATGSRSTTATSGSASVGRRPPSCAPGSPRSRRGGTRRPGGANLQPRGESAVE